MRRPLCILTVLLACAASPARAQDPVSATPRSAAAAAPARAGVPTQDPAPARIDSIFAVWDREGSPGCALGVLRDGRFVYQRGYGYANLDYGLPNGPDMVYYVGSVSKQFTAAAVALLAQEGKIGLDDDVRRYIPELPDYGAPITIRQLIHHTSGLRDIYVLMSLAGIRMEDVFPDQEALALIARQRELNFPPGTDYLYSNSGYFLLGQIVRRVTGRSLREYAAEKIFRPLGMEHTRFHDQPQSILPNRAISYGGSAESGFRITYLSNFDKIGAGGLYTTLGDLAKWDANFYEPKVGGPEFLRTMHTRGVLASGDTLSYAFGITVDRSQGLPMVRHGGSLMGFKADLVRYPTERMTIITLCNLGSIEPGPLADRVARLYLGDRMTPPPARPTATPARTAAAPRPPAAPTGTSLSAYAGSFWSDELEVGYELSVQGDTLRLTRRLHGTETLRAVGPDRFTTGGHTLVFRRDQDGRVSGFTVEAGRVRNIAFERRRQASWAAPGQALFFSHVSFTGQQGNLWQVTANGRRSSARRRRMTRSAGSISPS